jgi:signal transduction histidine kinase
MRLPDDSPAVDRGHQPRRVRSRDSSARRPLKKPCPRAEKPNRGPMLPVPEVVLLVDSHGHILRSSGRYAGPRLGDMDFAADRTVHEALHPGCDEPNCRFAASWARAWKAHEVGLPVEWEFASSASDWIFKLRLQSVNYACGALYGDRLDEFEDFSVLFIEDMSDKTKDGVDLASSFDGFAQADSASLIVGPETSSLSGMGEKIDSRLRTVARQLLVAQEAERRRIAAELHDGLGQTLSLLRFEIEGCLERAADDEIDTQTVALKRTCEHARRSLQELRDIMQDLRPTVLRKLGLIGSLELLCADFSAARPGVTLNCEFDGGDGHLPKDVAVALYRIVQEALSNIVHHADASETVLVFSTRNGGAELLIRDDGAGLPPETELDPGLGLITMRERAEALGGSFKINGSAGRGCSVHISWTPEAIRLLS